MRWDDIKEAAGVGRITKQNQTADVGPGEIKKQAAKFGNKVDKDGRPPTLSKKVKGSKTNVMFNLGMTENEYTDMELAIMEGGHSLEEGNLLANPKNTFLTKSDTAYDFVKLGTNMANLKSVPPGANVDEPDIMVAPYAGEKEMKYLMKQLKRIGYDVQDAQGYKDAHFDDKPTGGEAPPQIKKFGPLGKIKLDKLKSVQSERQWNKLGKQLVNVLNDDYAPLQIDRKGRIVNGHHRYDALRLTGAEYARVYMADDVLENMLDEGWSKKYKDSINCNNPKGFSQKAHCQGRKKKESIEEGYKLQLERDKEMLVLHIKDTATGKRTEVRGKSGYESGNHDPNDKLHQLLDKVGKSANISELINGEVVTINPKHPDAERAKKATDVAYNEAFIKPQFDVEWDEAARYPEFEKLGKKAWIKLAKKGKAVTIKSAKDINNTDAADPDAFKNLDKNKQARALAQLKSGDIEMPIVAVYSDGYKELVGGNTRLTAMMSQQGKATVWQFEVPDEVAELAENFADGKKKGKSRPGRVKKAGASCKGSVTSLRKKAKKYSGEKARMYHWCANMKSGRKKK